MDELTDSQIMSYARACRVAVTASQLSNWREKGLLGPYRRPGLGRGRGRKVLNWPGAHRLAVLVGRGLRTRRNLNAVGWEAWLQGYPVTRFARARLLTELDQWEAEARREVDAVPSHSSRRATTRRSPEAKSLTLIAQTWPAYRALLLGFAPSFSDLVRHETAFGRTVPRLEYGAALRKLEQAGEFIQVTVLRRTISETSDAELDRLRDDVLVGYGAFTKFIERVTRNAFRPVDPSVVLMWLTAGSLGADKGESFTSLARDLFRTLVREGLPPEAQAGVQAMRTIRKEIRRARRRAKLL